MDTMPKRTHRKERSFTAAQYTQPKQPGIANQLEALLTPAIFAKPRLLPSVGFTLRAY